MNHLEHNIPKLVAEDSRLDIEFELSVFDGPMIAQTEEGEIFKFEMGDGQLLKQLEDLLVGLEVDTSAKFTLTADQAFGRKNPNNFQTVPRSDFPTDMALNIGHVIGFNTPMGDEVPGTILEVTDESVVIDFNHPLTDKVIVFKAKIKAIY